MVTGRIRTHYDNLKVSREAPIEVIQAAFRSLAAKYHPDIHPGDEKAARIMGIINRSYAVLSDPVSRAEHDRWIAKAEAAPGSQEHRGPIPKFQPVSAETSFTKWSLPVAIGLLASIFVGVMVFIVYRSTAKVQRLETQVLQATPALEPKTIPKVQPPVRSEIDEVIHTGKYSQLPPDEVLSRSDGSRPPHLSILNDTGYTLKVTYYGSTERSVKVVAGQSLGLDFAPGTYRVLGRVSDPTVLPFVGNRDYATGHTYTSTFSVGTDIP